MKQRKDREREAHAIAQNAERQIDDRECDAQADKRPRCLRSDDHASRMGLRIGTTIREVVPESEFGQKQRAEKQVDRERGELVASCSCGGRECARERQEGDGLEAFGDVGEDHREPPVAPDLKVGPTSVLRSPDLKVGPTSVLRSPDLKVGPTSVLGSPDLKAGPTSVLGSPDL